ncbi:hypothetical protein [Xylocopilactobacillus apis]|uniref:Uncharacterized protein n=1 Tax=Xylocopilactobacillus apis TaxID=2932183 RepID=A0AAU9D311_9LACO|nr:hypothetical protein [Xylocopilactobacillus apis]BDR55780.1 hypothetical protein KIMC2_03420 [Xylocopilactobacillus apis]
MKNLETIKSEIISLPTIMNISEEIRIINDLMKVETEDLIVNKDIFRFIVDSLELSHADSGFMDVTKENEKNFINFYVWLRKINTDYGLSLNNNTIDVFGMSIEDINRSMNL